MSYDKWTSLPHMFFDKSQSGNQKPFLWEKTNGVYEYLSWSDVAHAVDSLANGLRAAGINRGDRIMLISENRPEWVIADLAIMSAGAITVPAYTTNQIKDHKHILHDSYAKAAFISTQELAKQFLPAGKTSDSLEFLVTMEEINIGDFNKLTLTWQGIQDLGKKTENKTKDLLKDLTKNDLACIIYTSGTGGSPKGVMLSHGSIMANCMGAKNVLDQLGVENEIFLSFLPLSHAYEHTAGLYFPISISAEIYFAEGIEKLATNLKEARPTLMISVPRLYDVMRNRILQAMAKQGSIKRILFHASLKLGTINYETPERLNLFDKIFNKLLDILVRKKIKERFGGRLKAMISGGAPLNIEVGNFFTALGVRLLQGYGQTEAAPVISCNRPNNLDLSTVGAALEGVSVKISSDGEILVAGDLVMKGYWNDEKLTSQTIRNGWLHTGDIGQLDNQNRIKITDRKKDIIVLSGGDNISPQRVEGVLTLQSEIAQAMIYGDKKPHLVALIVPDQDFVNRWKESHKNNAQEDELNKNKQFLKAMSSVVDNANLQLSGIERIKRFIITFNEFSVENELMTPTLKVRRHKINEIYEHSLNNLY